ncbi:MAG: NMCC_0638 family (lipo)protein [Alphaproteobacteria bacterium]
MRRAAAALVVLLGAWASGSRAAPTPSLGEDQARAAFNLYLQGCVTRVGEAEAQRRWAREGGLKPAQNSERFLRGRPGQAFIGPAAYGMFVLVSFDDGSCQVWAQRAALETLATSLDRLARGPARPGADVVKDLDRTGPGELGVMTRALGYSLGAAGHVVSLRLVGTSAAEAEFQAILSASETKK